jgi:hypothetical protein
MVQMLRTRLGYDEEVVGCPTCGTVQHLVDGAIHQCGADNNPLAVTIDTKQLKIALPAD